jgi:hypothetical protein
MSALPSRVDLGARDPTVVHGVEAGDRRPHSPAVDRHVLDEFGGKNPPPGTTRTTSSRGAIAANAPVKSSSNSARPAHRYLPVTHSASSVNPSSSAATSR